MAREIASPAMATRSGSLVEKLPFMTILCYFGSIIPDIHVTFPVTLDHFPVTLDISYHLDSVTKDHVFY